MAAELARGRQHVLQVGRAVLARRRADGDELHLAVQGGGARVGVEAEAPGGGIALHDLGQAGLVDRQAAFLQHRDLVGVDVEAEDIVADIGEAGARDEADVAGTDDRDFHGERAGPGPLFKG